jgi:hypothetical protein
MKVGDANFGLVRGHLQQFFLSQFPKMTFEQTENLNEDDPKLT